MANETYTVTVEVTIRKTYTIPIALPDFGDNEKLLRHEAIIKILNDYPEAVNPEIIEVIQHES